MIYIACILFPVYASGSPPEIVPGGIIQAIKAGNAADLAKYFNVNVELTLDQGEEIYSKDQAELILKDFFSKHAPNDFTILHKGGKEGSRYAIGNLSTTNGNFRVTILVKLKDSQSYIHQLRIEEENAQ
ncbi:MAG: DUF4783 domain-containing protein [Bacteroidales bacterium]|nr:DUF4783 domain-containing protein [Bacteroidales bacterium]